MLKGFYEITKEYFLFYLKLVKDINSKYFQLNPYAPCIKNNIIEGDHIDLV